MGMTGSGTLASQAGNATEKRSHQLFLLQSWKSSRLCLVQVSSTRDHIIFDHNFPSSVIFIQTEAAAAWPPTLVKFHRWMKCLATSRAAFPWTTEAMSCQGILGVLCLSMKSKEAETGSSDLKKSILHQEWDHQWCAYHRKAYLAESSPCAQSCSSLSRARIACSHATLWPPQAHFALGQRLKKTIDIDQLSIIKRRQWTILIKAISVSSPNLGSSFLTSSYYTYLKPLYGQYTMITTVSSLSISVFLMLHLCCLNNAPFSWWDFQRYCCWQKYTSKHTPQLNCISEMDGVSTVREIYCPKWYK